MAVGHCSSDLLPKSVALSLKCLMMYIICMKVKIPIVSYYGVAIRKVILNSYPSYTDVLCFYCIPFSIGTNLYAIKTHLQQVNITALLTNK